MTTQPLPRWPRMSAIIAWLAGELVVQPGVADGEPDFLEHVEDEREFLVGVGFAGQPLVEDDHAEQRLAVEDREWRPRAPRSWNSLAISRLVCASWLLARRMRPCRCRWPPMPAPSESAKCWRTLWSCPMAHAERSQRSSGASGLSLQHAGGFAQENDGAVDADDFAQEQEELLEQRRGVEAVREHAGKAPQRLERAHLIDVGPQRRRLEAARWRCGTSALRGSCSGKSRSSRVLSSLPRTGLVEDVLDAEQIGVLLPLPLLLAGDR